MLSHQHKQKKNIYVFLILPAKQTGCGFYNISAQQEEMFISKIVNVGKNISEKQTNKKNSL